MHPDITSLERTITQWHLLWTDLCENLIFISMWSWKASISGFYFASSLFAWKKKNLILRLRHLTLTVPLSTQVYKWVLGNLMLVARVTLQCTSIPSRGSRNTPSRFMLLKKVLMFLVLRLRNIELEIKLSIVMLHQSHLFSFRSSNAAKPW